MSHAIAGLALALVALPHVSPATAQPRKPVVAERYGHEETARQADWRMPAGRSAQSRHAATADEWREPARARANSPQHRVETGETLFRIARRYGVSVEALAAANGIDDPTTLRIGQLLEIPDPAAPSAAARPPQEVRSQESRRSEDGSRPWRGPQDRDARSGPQMPEQSRREPSQREPDSPRAHGAALRALAQTMLEPSGRGREGEMPAGYTFFAQFVGADLKTDQLVAAWLDGGARARRVSAELDLDIIYGGGPEADPERFYLPYIRTGRRLDPSGKRYALSRAMAPAGHTFVIQLQAAFIELHNRAVDLLIERHLAAERNRYCGDAGCSNAELARALPDPKRLLLFQDARETVIHYYHRIIVEDFLPRLIGPERTQDIISNGRDLFFAEGFRDEDGGTVREPFIPYEFALAAYQFTASQLRPSYVLREGRRARRIDPALLIENRPPRAPEEPQDLADWRYLVDILAEPPEGFNFARRIDPYIAGLHHPDRGSRAASDPAARILVAGARAALPDGQRVASKLLPDLRRRGLLYLWNTPQAGRSDGDEVWEGYRLAPDRPVRETLGRAGTPLWYYVLQEADMLGEPTGFGHDAQAYALSSRAASTRFADARNNSARPAFAAGSAGGHTLGPVGGTIVGEVLVGLAEHYALKTGKGLGFQPPIGASVYGERQRFGLTRVRARNGDLGERYLLRNLLIDAGASVSLR